MNPHPGAVAVLAAAGATQALTGQTGVGVAAGLVVAVGLVWHTTHTTHPTPTTPTGATAAGATPTGAGSAGSGLIEVPGRDQP